jgi:hypothetical protein
MCWSATCSTGQQAQAAADTDPPRLAPVARGGEADAEMFVERDSARTGGWDEAGARGCRRIPTEPEHRGPPHSAKPRLACVGGPGRHPARLELPLEVGQHRRDRAGSRRAEDRCPQHRLDLREVIQLSVRKRFVLHGDKPGAAASTKSGFTRRFFQCRRLGQGSGK